MISPEVLRRYPYFSFMDHMLLREVAMITEEVEAYRGQTLFSLGEEAVALYLLAEGVVHLHVVVADEHRPELRKDFMVGVINPGELLGISSIIEPHVLMASAIAVEESRLLKIDAAALRKMMGEDVSLACGLHYQLAMAAKERLRATRVQLAAATTPV